MSSTFRNEPQMSISRKKMSCSLFGMMYYLQADVVDASLRFFVQEALNGALLSERLQQLDLRVLEVDEYGRDAVFWKRLKTNEM